ncbi:MAG: hypothetical protein D6738_11025, partial [Acidobacteria bacterium]
MDRTTELIATLAVIAAGAILGRASWRGVRLDVTAVLLLGAGAAQLGITLSPTLGLFGLLLFLYAIGVQAGPALRRLGGDERRAALAAAGALVVLSAVTLAAAHAAGLPTGVGLGVLAGLFTSGASLALAEAGWPASEVSVGFALAAPVASLLVMLAVQGWHRAAEPRIADELARWNEEMSRRAPRIETALAQVTRAEVAGRTLRELRLPAEVAAIFREGRWLAPRGATALSAGDILRLAGSREALDRTIAMVGRRTHERPHRLAGEPVVRLFFVSSPRAVGRRIEALRLRERFDATITRVRRSGIELMPRAGLRLLWGDRVQVSAPESAMDELRRLFGDDAHNLERFAFPRAALVIVAGGLLGLAPVPLAGGAVVRLGPATGVLAASLLTAALHRTGPLIWSQTHRTTALLAQIGLPLFLAEVGNRAWGGLVQALPTWGLPLLVPAAAGVGAGIALAALVGRALRLGPLATLSLFASLLLNTPAFQLIQQRHREKIPSAIYAAV